MDEVEAGNVVDLELDEPFAFRLAFAGGHAFEMIPEHEAAHERNEHDQKKRGA
jgi:hypothetical protein